MFTETFNEVLKHNGVVSITTWADGNAHVSNTWNSYLVIEENRIYIPAGWLHKTEANTKINNKVILTLGSPEVQGKLYLGTGFVVKGTAKFICDNEKLEKMKETFPWATRVLEVTVESITQTL